MRRAAVRKSPKPEEEITQSQWIFFWRPFLFAGLRSGLRITKTKLIMNEMFHCVSSGIQKSNAFNVISRVDTTAMYKEFCPLHDNTHDMYLFDVTCPEGEYEVICEEKVDGIPTGQNVTETIRLFRKHWIDDSENIVCWNSQLDIGTHWSD